MALDTDGCVMITNATSLVHVPVMNKVICIVCSVIIKR